MSKIKSVLVTGGAGFIGSHTVEKLVQNGLSVKVLDNLSTGSLGNLKAVADDIEFIQGDIRNSKDVNAAAQGVDAVLHLAALVSVAESIESPQKSCELNILGFLRVLDAAKNNKVKRVVYASSAAVYGGNEKLPLSVETSMCTPMSPYGLEKLTNEGHARLYGEIHNIETVGLRYFNVYGPRQNPSSEYAGVISKFIDCAANDMDFTIFGDGEQSRDFIYVEDVAQANSAALFSNGSGVFNVATGKATSLKELAKSINKNTNKALKTIYLPERAGDIKQSLADTSLTKSSIKFRSSVSIQEGLKNTFNSNIKDNLK